MRYPGPIYEGDGLIHGWLASQRTAGAVAKLAKHAEKRIPGVLELAGWFFQRLERWAYNARCRDTERYLARSTDLCDLERRMRTMEQHKPPFA
jgi:hypothetical protein